MSESAIEHINKVSTQIAETLSPEARASVDACITAQKAVQLAGIAYQLLSQIPESISPEYSKIGAEIEKQVEQLIDVVENHHEVLRDRLLPQVEATVEQYLKQHKQS